VAQARMKGYRGVLLLGGVFLILLAALWVQEGTGGTPAIETPGPDVALLDATATEPYADIEQVVLEDPGAGRRLTLQRESGGEWSIAQFPAAINQDRAMDILHLAGSLVFETYVGAFDDDVLAEYGLAAGSANLLLRIRQVDGEEPAMLVGDLLPSGDAFYVVVVGDTNVFTSPRQPIEELIFVLDSYGQ
jgi:hypothetical protein